jgi:hypothetical protein
MRVVSPLLRELVLTVKSPSYPIVQYPGVGLSGVVMESPSPSLYVRTLIR